MMRRIVVLAMLLGPLPLSAQDASPGDLMARAVRAYQNLDFDVATSLLRRALTPPLVNRLDDAERARALTHLGAAEHYSLRRDSAVAVFRRLVMFAPRHRPDTLIFSPEITRLYDDVHRRTPSVAVGVPADSVASDTGGAGTRMAQVPPRAEISGRDTVPAPRPATELPERPDRASTRRSPAGAVVAQTTITGTGAGLVQSVRARSVGGDGSRVSGTAVGLAGIVRFRRFELEVRYAEGVLQPTDRQLVEGAVALRFVATPWLAVQAGPQARSYTTPAGSERWLTWQLGARGETPIVGANVRGHALLWRGFGLEVNVPPGSGTARGGEIGVTIDLPPGPLWFGLTYGIDRAEVAGAGRRETVETLTFMPGLRRR